MKICIFGDSITWGARLPFRVGWANLLRNYLEKVSDYHISVYDLGIDGDTTEGLLLRFDIEASARNPDSIILAIGTNDSCYRLVDKKNSVSPEKFEKNIRNLVQKSLNLTKNVFIVGLAKGNDLETVPLLRSTTGKCYDRENIQKYNHILKKVCAEENVTFIDIIEKLKENDFDDGLHPNVEGHLKIYESVRQSIMGFLNIDTEEYFTLVDKQDNEVGYKKRESIESTDRPRVIGLWIENEKDEILIAKRPYDKKRDPAKWGPAVASLVKKDTTYRKCLLESAQKEIGLKSFDFEEKDKILIEGYNNFYIQWFYTRLNKSIGDFKLDSNEVSELRWVKKSDLEKEVKEKPFMFVQAFDNYFNLF